MYLFSRYITPFIAVIVLVIGLISASYDGEGTNFKYKGFLLNAVPTYFLAKTIFCSTSLFLLGQLLAEIIQTNRRRHDTN